MYDKLVKRLNVFRLKEDEHQFIPVYVSELIGEAADAIEELQEDNAALNGTVSNLIQQIEELSKPKWIPVAERLPEDMEMVIGYTPCDGFMFVGYHVTSIYHDRDFSYWNIVTAMRSTKKMMKKVTHWMPLPEPPKEE